MLVVGGKDQFHFTGLHPFSIHTPNIFLRQTHNLLFRTLSASKASSTGVCKNVQLLKACTWNSGKLSGISNSSGVNPNRTVKLLLNFSCRSLYNTEGPFAILKMATSPKFNLHAVKTDVRKFNC